MEQKLKQRICIEICVKLQISATETFKMPNKAFPNDPQKEQLFLNDILDLKLAEFLLKMILGKNAQNVQKITDLIKENPRTTLLELEQDTGISKTTIGRIVTKDLKLKKTPAKFIPIFLTNEQKLCRLATCENMLEMTRTDPEWKDKIITGDETWVYDYDPETKRQYAEWRGQGSSFVISFIPTVLDFHPDTLLSEMERFLIREGASDKQNQNENKEDKKIVKSTGNKRKYVEDYLKYGFIPSVNDPSLPFCLICQKTLSSETMVPSKLLRHIETNHREQMNNPISYFENIRSSFQKQSKKFKKFMTTSDEAQTASYMIAQLIARKKKAHAEAEEIILPALKIVAGCMLTNDAMEKVTKIPLSSKTIARRIEDMSEDIELQIKQSFNDSSTKWAIQLDETTDISNKAQLLAFLRFVDTGKIVNNYFFCKELKQRTTGADIFELVDENVMKYNLRWENCVSV
ncbi:hypothetical protein LAZ67_15001747 [Cordylochernes scorpioides]|uniref:Transposase n=1 Tax=Cordylochernes scorpioides TaxID=51811 RepID=A0ABY6L985_9ARAC|nr:hypothetical protein LAZ67_15001747 [Cordylochernes scorpioides]